MSEIADAISKLCDTVNELRNENAKLEAERNLYKGKYRAFLKLISRTRSQLVHVTDHIEDEGDRAYFGSTNDADALKELYHEMMSWIWDATDETNRMKADPYATIREQSSRIAALEAENADLRSDEYLVRVIEERERLRKVLLECEEYFDNRADADCDQDGYIPNDEMKMLTVVRPALEAKP